MRICLAGDWLATGDEPVFCLHELCTDTNEESLASGSPLSSTLQRTKVMMLKLMDRLVNIRLEILNRPLPGSKFGDVDLKF